MGRQHTDRVERRGVRQQQRETDGQRGGIGGGGGERCSPHSPAQSGPSRYPSPVPSFRSPALVPLLVQ